MEERKARTRGPGNNGCGRRRFPPITGAPPKHRRLRGSSEPEAKITTLAPPHPGRGRRDKSGRVHAFSQLSHWRRKWERRTGDFISLSAGRRGLGRFRRGGGGSVGAVVSDVSAGGLAGRNRPIGKDGGSAR